MNDLQETIDPWVGEEWDRLHWCTNTSENVEESWPFDDDEYDYHATQDFDDRRSHSLAIPIYHTKPIPSMGEKKEKSNDLSSFFHKLNTQENKNPFASLSGSISRSTSSSFSMRPSPKELPLFLSPFANERDGPTMSATVTPQNSCEMPSLLDTAASGERGWVRETCSKLSDNPSLMTPHVLMMALQKQPPVHVIRFMLSVNPKAGNIPDTGPTPLQVAVQYNASLDVIEVLLRACPFAICVTNPQHAEDPLSYAKRHHKTNKALIELLSRPLGHWINEKKSRDPNASLTSFNRSGGGEIESRIPPPEDVITAPTATPTTVATTTTTTAVVPASSSSSSELATSPVPDRALTVDKQEIDNVKLLCAHVVRGHKKISKHVSKLQAQVDDSRSKRSEIFQDMEQLQRKQFHRQLIALDMKERAFKAYVDRMEKRCMEYCDAKVKSWQDGMTSWQVSTESKLDEWKVLLDHEITINAHFRNDLSQWMEEQFNARRDDTPVMFATNLGEMDDEMPLVCSKENNSSSLGTGTSTIKKKSRKPLFRNWDRSIMLDDEKEEHEI